MFREVQADLAHLISESNAQFRVSWEVESLDYAPKNLRSILHNLISNALKYRSPARMLEVSIATFSREGKTALRVADNGLGLSSQQKEGLFTMFKRFHNHVDGSGVGLYMIKRMVENNGGSIEVESQLEEGTTFTVYF
jgi:light-regulated signal transduction histidine kinase (bacteriophytochrome)